MPLPNNISASIAGELPALKAAKAGGYYFLVMGKKVPWLMVGRSATAAAEKYREARKMILASDRLEFTAGSRVAQGQLLFKANRMVLVLDEASAEKVGDPVQKWLASAAVKLATQESGSPGGKEIRQIAALLTHALVVGVTEEARMKELDGVGDGADEPTGIEVETPQFDEGTAEEVERVKAPIGIQLASVVSDDVALAASTYDALVFEGINVKFQNATRDFTALLGDTWAETQLNGLLAMAPALTPSPSSWLLEVSDDYIAECNACRRLLLDVQIADSDAPDVLRARVAQTITALRRLREALEEVLVRCALCTEPVDVNVDAHPHAADLACKLWYHQACLDGAPANQLVSYVILRADGPGKPTRCPTCKAPVDARDYRDLIGVRTASELYEMTQRVPDEERYSGRVPIGGFPCPGCGTPYGWGGGCDIVSCPRPGCGDYNIFTGKRHKLGHRGHDGNFRQGMNALKTALDNGTLIRRLQGSGTGDAKAAEVVTFLRGLGLNHKQIELLRIEPTVRDCQDAAMAGEVDEIDAILGPASPSPAFDELHAALRAYYRRKAAKHAPSEGGSCCYLTTACTAARGLPDDCEELTELRRFRDGWLMAQPEGPALVQTYYDLAPRILDGIEGRTDGDALLDQIYQVVRACVERIRAGDPEGALSAYRAMSEGLAAELGG